MKKYLQNTLPDGGKKLLIVSIILTLAVAAALTIWGIYGIGEYGIALFILVPLLIGVMPAVIYSIKKPVTKRLSFLLALQTLGLLLVLLVVFAIEGLICIAMAAPVAILFTFIGSIIGYELAGKNHNPVSPLLILILLIPAVSFVESKTEPVVTPVTTSVIINADPSTVWSNVIAFPKIKGPEEFLFKTGIAYPTDATIKGSGAGAVRHCNFTTGAFVEPITIWNEPYMLAFDVEEQPAPMKELSFWDIKAPHLHDYFVSTKGQFN